VHKWRCLYLLSGCIATSAVADSMGATSQGTVTISVSVFPRILRENVGQARELRGQTEQRGQAICLTRIAGEFSARLEAPSGNSMALPVSPTPGQTCTSVRVTWGLTDASPSTVFFVAE
jgi:hypothetical protein